MLPPSVDNSAVIYGLMRNLPYGDRSRVATCRAKWPSPKMPYRSQCQTLFEIPIDASPMNVSRIQ